MARNSLPSAMSLKLHNGQMKWQKSHKSLLTGLPRYDPPRSYCDHLATLSRATPPSSLFSKHSLRTFGLSLPHGLSTHRSKTVNHIVLEDVERRPAVNLHVAGASSACKAILPRMDSTHSRGRAFPPDLMWWLFLCYLLATRERGHSTCLPRSPWLDCRSCKITEPHPTTSSISMSLAYTYHHRFEAS